MVFGRVASAFWPWVSLATSARDVFDAVRAWLRRGGVRGVDSEGVLVVQVRCGIARSLASALRKVAAHGHRFGNRIRCLPLWFTSRPGSAMKRVRMVRATVS